MEHIYRAVEAENARQLAKWGVQNHSIGDWICIILEEFGEAAEAANKGQLDQYRKELIEVAACCVAAVENLDRQRLDPALNGQTTAPDTENAQRGLQGH